MSFWKNIKTVVYRELFQQLHNLLLIFQLNLSFGMWKEYATWNVIFNMNFTSQSWHHRINWKPVFHNVVRYCSDLEFASTVRWDADFKDDCLCDILAFSFMKKLKKPDTQYFKLMKKSTRKTCALIYVGFFESCINHAILQHQGWEDFFKPRE